MTSGEPHRSPLALVLLALLFEAPMHPYRMLRTIRERGQDQLVNVAQRNSVYQVLDRLVREGLARAGDVARDPGRPERTVYEITPEGSTTLRNWLVAMLPAPAREFPEFPVALAFLAVLEPPLVQSLLTERIEAVAAKLTSLTAQAPPGLPRLFLIEDEYRSVLLTAELAWLRGVVADLEAGTLTWDKALLDQALADFRGF